MKTLTYEGYKNRCIHFMPQNIPIYKKNLENYNGKRFVDEDFNQILREKYNNPIPRNESQKKGAVLSKHL